jgi:hypothetical protein
MPRPNQRTLHSEIMKKLIPTSFIAALALVTAAPVAEARHPHRGSHHATHVYISGYRSCGTPVYQERYIRSYRRCGTPVWGYRVVNPPRYHVRAPRYYYHPQPIPVCPPPPGYYRGSRVIIHGSWGF